MKLITSLFAGIYCFTLGACQHMPNTPSSLPQREAASQTSSGFSVSQAFAGGTIGFGGGFAAPAPAPITIAPIAAPAFSATPLSAPLIRTPINNSSIATAPIPATSFPSASFSTVPLAPVAPLSATAPFPATSIPAAPLPAAPFAAAAPITTTVPGAAATVRPAAAGETKSNEPLSVAPPVGHGSKIPPPGIGYGYTNTYTSTLKDE